MTIFGIYFYDILGTFGVSLIVISYFLLHVGKLQSRDFLYSFLNGIGSLLVLISLIYEFNFPSFIVEIFWLLISIYGMIKYFMTNKIRKEKNGS
jgi:predicted membrane protein